ncbi:hypothetical protein JW887_07070 [Candidatus Dojkabacteria bacterium]|nr:hypothetical protein [Candidatus Dojkabacteria bacterium]
MKIYLAHSSIIDYKKELYAPIKKSALIKNHEFVFFCDNPNYKSQNSRKMIQSCDLLIAEMSECSTGMGIEIGWANMMNKPIIIIGKNKKLKEGYMRTIANTIIIYSDTNDLIKQLDATISKINISNPKQNS